MFPIIYQFTKLIIPYKRIHIKSQEGNRLKGVVLDRFV